MTKNILLLRYGGKILLDLGGVLMDIILVYDICLDEEGSKVLRNVFKICKKYLTHIQNSVFEGELTKAQIVKLKTELDNYIRKSKDSLIIFKSRDEKWMNKEFWGIKDDATSCFI